jgi:hypothetical protein
MSELIPDVSEACPFIDDNQASCSSHFKLGHLSEAFGDCIGGFQSCTHYWRMNSKLPQPHPVITLTAYGRPLQPTGS